MGGNAASDRDSCTYGSSYSTRADCNANSSRTLSYAKFADGASYQHDWTADADYNQSGRRGNSEHHAADDSYTTAGNSGAWFAR